MPPMNIERRSILLVAPVAFALANWLANDVAAADLQEAKVTQVVQEVKVLPSGGAARPATINETVRQGNAVQTGVQSRSELTFRDQTITRLGEKTIYTIGGGREIELGSGQFLLYVPKKAGGAKVKMGPVTAAITGTTVVGNVSPSGVVEFTVLEGTARVRLDRVGQCMLVVAGQKVTYDPIAMRLQDPVEVDIQQQLNSPLVTGFRQLPSTPYLNAAIENQRRGGAGVGGAELARAVAAAGAGSIETAAPDQFMQAFNSLLVRYPQREVCELVATAARARPDLADRIVVAAVTGMRPVRGYSKDYRGKEMPCDSVQCIVDAAIAASPRMADQIINALVGAAPMLRDCIGEPCFPANEFIPPYIISPLDPQVPVSPEQPPTTSNRD
jgi:FecR protein